MYVFREESKFDSVYWKGEQYCPWAYCIFQVAAGQPIGTVTGSDCDNHIHLAMQKDGGSYIDPTKYVESIYPKVSKWKQVCDDYKLVYKVVYF